MAQSGTLPITFANQNQLFLHSTQAKLLLLSFIMASYKSVVNINIIMKFPIGHKAFVSLCTMSHSVLLSLTEKS